MSIGELAGVTATELMRVQPEAANCLRNAKELKKDKKRQDSQKRLSVLTACATEIYRLNASFYKVFNKLNDNQFKRTANIAVSCSKH
jgi:hypothetical protein